MTLSDNICTDSKYGESTGEKVPSHMPGNRHAAPVNGHIFKEIFATEALFCHRGISFNLIHI